MKRKQVRLKGFDYSASGAYFITVCVQNKLRVLSSIRRSESNLTRAGQLVYETWLDLPKHYPSIELDAFVVMPNHFHGLLWIQDMKISIDDVGAGFKPAPTRHGLSELVRGLKTFSARSINQLLSPRPKFAWQRGFYEHVIRDAMDLFNHRQYIRENPARWENDQYRF